MKLIPVKAKGIVSVSNVQQIHYLNQKKYILVCNFSSIYQYEIKRLKLVKKSPLLHYNNFINCILSVKNRTFVTINSTLHVLDYLIPVTRIKIFNGTISNIIRLKDKFFLFSNIDQKGYILDLKTLSILKQLSPISKILYLSKNQKTFKKNLLLFYTSQGSVEIWNIDSMKKVCSLEFNFPFFPNRFFISNNKDNIFLNLPTKFLYVFNSKNNKKYLIRNKKLEHFESYSSIKGKLDIFLIKCKNELYLIKHKRLYKTYLIGNEGKINFAEAIKENLLLTIGFHDNTIAVHILNEKNGKFSLLKKKSGKYFPVQNISNHVWDKLSFLIENQFKKKKKIHVNLMKKGIKYSISTPAYQKITRKPQPLYLKNLNVFVKQIIVKPNLHDLHHYKIAILFFNSQKIWLWDVNTKIQYFSSSDFIRNEGNLYNISCINISNRTEIVIIGHEDNFISFAHLTSGKFVFHGKNHDFFDLIFRCKIKFCELDPSETLLVTYCSHGVLNLWNLVKLKIEKTLVLKGLGFLKWSSIRDLIYMSGVEGEIFLIFPQNFYTIRVLKNHMTKIIDLSLFMKERYLISSSYDKTVVIWDLLENKCCDKIKFKFCPFSIRKENNDFIYFSHQGTIGISQWTLSNNIRNQDIKEKGFFKMKNKFENEVNFRFSKSTENRSCLVFSKKNFRQYPKKKNNHFFIQSFPNSKIIIYFKSRITSKFLKKIFLNNINTINKRIGKKLMASNKIRHYLLVLSYDLIHINFFITETLSNNFVGKNANLSFLILFLEFFSFLDNTFRSNKIFYLNFKKFLIDIINII